MSEHASFNRPQEYVRLASERLPSFTLRMAAYTFGMAALLSLAESSAPSTLLVQDAKDKVEKKEQDKGDLKHLYSQYLDALGKKGPEDPITVTRCKKLMENAPKAVRHVTEALQGGFPASREQQLQVRAMLAGVARTNADSIDALLSSLTFETERGTNPVAAKILIDIGEPAVAPAIAVLSRVPYQSDSKKPGPDPGYEHVEDVVAGLLVQHNAKESNPVLAALRVELKKHQPDRRGKVPVNLFFHESFAFLHTQNSQGMKILYRLLQTEDEELDLSSALAGARRMVRTSGEDLVPRNDAGKTVIDDWGQLIAAFRAHRSVKKDAVDTLEKEFWRNAPEEWRKKLKKEEPQSALPRSSESYASTIEDTANFFRAVFSPPAARRERNDASVI